MTFTVTRAAEYVRMSTDHQKYSTMNQQVVLREYAARRGFEIVRTYEDAGKSGLKIDGRDALKRLIADVETGNTDYTIILVYDVSRWGRFQDVDESAYYEYVCKRAGIAVEYCAEQFDNDGSPVSMILKGIKRAMAAEYSRELSAKVFAGQARLVERGYRQGGIPGFGLRRMLIDEQGKVKGYLDRGERKNLQTDRVILVPGPEEEVAIIRGVYTGFVHDGHTEQAIAEDLNRRRILDDLGRPWSRRKIRSVLTNAKYVGDNVWNRLSFKLNITRLRNEPARWLRADGAFQAIVERDVFEAAAAILRVRSSRHSDQEMLALLSSLLEVQGTLSGPIINQAKGMMSAHSYRERFGGLEQAYKLVGFKLLREGSYFDINRSLRRQRVRLVSEITDGFCKVGADVKANENGVLIVNSEFTVWVVMMRFSRTCAGSPAWSYRDSKPPPTDIVVAVRMDAANREILDYYLFPRVENPSSTLRHADFIGLAPFENLDALYQLGRRTQIAELPPCQVNPER